MNSKNWFSKKQKTIKLFYLFAIISLFSRLSASDIRTDAATSSNSCESEQPRRMHFVLPYYSRYATKTPETLQEHLDRLKRELLDSEFSRGFSKSVVLMKYILGMEHGISVDVAELEKELENKRKELKEEDNKHYDPKFDMYSFNWRMDQKSQALESEIRELSNRIYLVIKQNYEKYYHPTNVTLYEAIKSQGIQEKQEAVTLETGVDRVDQSDFDKISQEFPSLDYIRVQLNNRCEEIKFEDKNVNVKRPGVWFGVSDGLRGVQFQLYMARKKRDERLRSGIDPLYLSITREAEIDRSSGKYLAWKQTRLKK